MNVTLLPFSVDTCDVEYEYIVNGWSIFAKTYCS